MTDEHIHPGDNPLKTDDPKAKTADRPRLRVSFDGSRWRVILDGFPLENLLTPGGLEIRAAPDGPVPRCEVRMTFADVELDADLRDVIVQAAISTHYPGSLVETERDGDWERTRVRGPGAQSPFDGDENSAGDEHENPRHSVKAPPRVEGSGF